MPDLRWLLACALLAGCGTPNEGGGTELPSPIQIIVLNPDAPALSARLAVKQGVLWSVADSTPDSVTLLSRGLLASTDSSSLVLPPNGGLYLVEAWTTPIPARALPLMRRVSWQALLQDPDISVLGASAQGTPSPLTFAKATNYRLGASDSSSSATYRKLVRITGAPPHSTVVLATSSWSPNRYDTIVQQNAFLWSLENDSLTFRGITRSSSGSVGSLLSPEPGVRYVLEIWANQAMVPASVSLRRPAEDLTTSWSSCALHLGRLGNNLTLYACPNLPASLQRDSASSWASFDYLPD